MQACRAVLLSSASVWRDGQNYAILCSLPPQTKQWEGGADNVDLVFARRLGRDSMPLSVQTFRTYVQPSREVVMVAFVPVSPDSFIKKARCTYVLTPLRKPSQSVCAFGLTSWGFMVNGSTVEMTATNLGVDPCPQYGNRKSPKVRTWAIFVCFNADLVCHP